MSKRGMAGPFACTVAVLASRNATMSSKAMTSKYFVRFIGNYTTRGLIMDIASHHTYGRRYNNWTMVSAACRIIESGTTARRTGPAARGALGAILSTER